MSDFFFNIIFFYNYGDCLQKKKENGSCQIIPICNNFTSGVELKKKWILAWLIIKLLKKKYIYIYIRISFFKLKTSKSHSISDVRVPHPYVAIPVHNGRWQLNSPPSPVRRNVHIHIERKRRSPKQILYVDECDW